MVVLVGKIRQVSDPTGVYGFAYDNMGRLIGTTTQYSFLPGQTYTNAYSYDAASNRKSLTAPDGSITTYGYDSLNRLNGLANSWAGSFGFGYDALSRRTSLTRPNGVNTSYSYDSVSHLLSVLHQAGTNILDGASYTYDPSGNRSSKTNYLNGVTEHYTYDPLYELTQVTQEGSTTESYSYDAVGNRLSSLGVPSYQYNASNELTTSSLGGYTYDNNGNTLTDAHGRSFTWDFENRLTQVTLPQTGGGSSIVTFKYDPFGRRIQKSGPLGTTNYLYDGIDVLEEVDNSGGVLARYGHGAVIDEDLSMLRSGSATYYQGDAEGSITSLSNPSGTLSSTYVYDASGNLTASTGSLINPFQYTGRESDSETGLYYYRARYYNAQLGRFVSEDPAGFAGGPNFYDYAKNRPTNLIDPTGLFTVRNGIREHDQINIDSVCGPGTGGACTSATALLMCTCTQDDCPISWKAHAELRLYGDMYIYNGPWATFPRRPKDKSVHDIASARAHEWGVHLNPAIAAVTPLINALEAKSFSSESECQADCDKTSTAVTNQFRQTLRATQQQENNQ
jgi:RHS repeat-associated protein